MFSAMDRFICYCLLLCQNPLLGSAFDENTPKLVATRRKMLDMLDNDKCNELNSPASWYFPWKTVKAKQEGDRACAKALRLLVSLTMPEIYECAGAIWPQCRLDFDIDAEKNRWTCTVLFYDGDRLWIPLTLNMRFCTKKSRKIYATYQKNFTKDGEINEASGLSSLSSSSNSSKDIGKSTESEPPRQCMKLLIKSHLKQFCLNTISAASNLGKGISTYHDLLNHKYRLKKKYRHFKLLIQHPSDILYYLGY